MPTLIRQMSVGVILVAALSMGACTPGPSANPTSTPRASATPLASASPSPPASAIAEEPRLQFQGTALERLDASGKTLWKAELPAEKSRQMAVLGETVLVWGPSNNLRRFDIDSGKQTDLTLAAGKVSVFGIHDDILVQSADTGLAGIAEKSNIWHRADLFTDSMVVGVGPEENPVVLLILRENGRAKAIHLKDGKDSTFPVPPGAFARIQLERDSNTVIWTPEVDGAAVHRNADDGTPL